MGVLARAFHDLIKANQKDGAPPCLFRQTLDVACARL